MKLKNYLIKLIPAFCLAVMLSATTADKTHAAIYKYIDHKGTEFFTDDINSVPAEFRKKVIKIYGDEEAKVPSKSGKTVTKEPDTAAKSEEAKWANETTADKIIDERLFKSGLAIIVLIAVFVLVKKIRKALGPGYIGTLIRIVFTLGVLLYVYTLYSKDMIDTFRGVNEAATHVKSLEEDRDKKINETVNQLFPEQKKEQ